MDKSSLNRRNFLRLGAAATAGFATSSHVTGATEKTSSKTDKKIITRQLGNTGISVPVVSMGVMRADNSNILKAAYNLGVKHFDTAHGYQEGRNEEMVGEFFKDKPRDSFIVATKIHPSKDASTQDFLDMLEVSLERLQMSYVDILYLHAVNDEEYLHNPKFMAAMKKAKEEGKAKHLGFSTHRNMAKLINSAVTRGFYGVILTSYNFRHVDNTELNEAIKKAHNEGVGIIGMKNMAGGFLDEEKTKPVNGKAALKFALSNPHIHTCIPGISSYEMLMENWSVAKDVNLSPSEKQDLELASNETGMYCTGCDTCAGQCKRDLPVSDLMRSYMYNYAYAYPAKARETVVALGVSDSPCDDCDECSVKCQSGFDVRNRITNIARIQNVPNEFLV
ncbi:aldo/keto reductase [Marinilabilia rubra]|uniref:Oxidoreductase n=1 Tax=Marinilabilia rubra TaxID=2162893 RepID=A0A2U2BDZ0_9BACT|nr:aldo/keto reductase [Marinilabilia rubra]PWE01279.1 oxidoreductase [Marinilabilia rubra]